ncbi:hypothetical protein R5R35_010695 [Gryllus longicercus]|uniref:Uncharacterized protein n=1 Tax=Gryllus longicercus TaxID=2509291 RepID=A0AAN9Z2G0_9ORTH
MEFLPLRGVARRASRSRAGCTELPMVRSVQGKLCFSYTPNVVTAAIVSRGLLLMSCSTVRWQ